MDLDPISGDWNTGVNWMPDGMRNGPNDIAAFGLLNNRSVSVSANTLSTASSLLGLPRTRALSH